MRRRPWRRGATPVPDDGHEGTDGGLTDGGLTDGEATDGGLTGGEATAGEVTDGVDLDVGRPRRVASVVAILGVAVLGVVVGVVPVPFVVYSPGVVENTLGTFRGRDIVAVSGRPTYPTDGTLSLTTISVTRADSSVGLTEAVLSWLDPRRQVLPYDLVYQRSQTAEQARAEGQAQMQSSQDDAVLAAARQVGIPVDTTTQVSEVTAGGPSAGRLSVGERIVAVDGRAVSGRDAVAEAVRAHRPGTTVTFSVLPAPAADGTDSTGTGSTGTGGTGTRGTGGGAARQVRVTAGTPPAGSGVPAGSGYVGILLADSERARGLQADIQLGQVIGGPSAGLMFSLAIVDRLTPGTLPGGIDVAGTGTIDADGTVGGIGGIAEKMIGARDSGATLFLVPPSNCTEAVEHRPDGLRLVRAGNLGDAVAALRDAAAGRTAALPSC